jgi:hypothetical protein
MALTCVGQTFTIDADLNQSTAKLFTCVKPACDPGGNPAGPTSVSSQIVQTSPCPYPTWERKELQLLQLSVSGPSYVNALWSYKMGAMDNATHFSLTFDACFDESVNTAQAFEVDVALFSHPTNTNYMFGGQCDLKAGVFDVWDQASRHWIPTDIVCTPTTLVANVWHHFERDVHYDSSKALWFDYLCIDSFCYGQNKMGKYSAGALPGNWNSTRIWQFQLDLGSDGGTATVWLNNITGKAWQ